MWIGWIEFDLIIDRSASLKEKRAVIKPLIAELRRRFQLSAAEVDHQELHRRAGLGVGCVAGDRTHLVEVLDAAERLVASRWDVEMIKAERSIRRSGDE